MYARFGRSPALRAVGKSRKKFAGPPPWPNPGSAQFSLMYSQLWLIAENSCWVISNFNGFVGKRFPKEKRKIKLPNKPVWTGIINFFQQLGNRRKAHQREYKTCRSNVGQDDGICWRQTDGIPEPWPPCIITYLPTNNHTQQFLTGIAYQAKYL